VVEIVAEIVVEIIEIEVVVLY